MKWIAKATGDMTLSVLDLENNNFQVLKIDMLSAGTLKAGEDGELLFQALNDLGILAAFSIGQYSCDSDVREYPDSAMSPLPWKCEYNENSRRLVIKAGGKKLADRQFPTKVSDAYISEIVSTLCKGIECINSQNTYDG